MIESVTKKVNVLVKLFLFRNMFKKCLKNLWIKKQVWMNSYIKLIIFLT